MAFSKLGDVIFSVNTGEKINLSNTITDKPVENGSSISDHVNPTPLKVSFSGIVVGEDAHDKLRILRQYSNEGTILRYIARNDIDHVVIESLSTNHDNKIRNGFSFDISLKRIKIATQQTTTVDLSKIKIPNIDKDEKVKKTEKEKQKKTRIKEKTKQGKKQKTIKEINPPQFDAIQNKINARLGG